MMLQLFLTILMLVFAAFETIILYEGYFVARSVSQLEEYICQRSVLEFLSAHGAACLIDGADARARVRSSLMYEYIVPLHTFYPSTYKDHEGLISITSSGEKSFVIKVSSRRKLANQRYEILATETYDLAWDERLSAYRLRRVINS